MTRRPVLSLIASVVLAAWLAGCGSVSDGSAASPAPPTEEGPTAAGPTVEATRNGAQGDGADGWVTLTDEPTGARFALPGHADRQDDTAAVEDGSEVTLRTYSATAHGGAVEVGFNVIDTPGMSYDLVAGVAGVAESLDGSVVESADIEVDGYSAVDVEVSYGDGMLVLFQLIRTDEHVMQPLASGPESERGMVEAAYERLTTSVEVD